MADKALFRHHIYTLF